MLNIQISKKPKINKVSMVLAISRNQLIEFPSPPKKTKRLRKLTVRDVMEEVEDVDTNDDSLKEQQN